MSLIIKAAIRKGDENSEFRRFTLIDEDKNYDSLEKKLAELFSVENSPLMWKDADGDFVTFSSDEELQEAFKCMTDGILKIYVTDKPIGIENEYGHNKDHNNQGPKTKQTPRDSNKKKCGRRGKTWLLHGNVPFSENAEIRNRLLTDDDDTAKLNIGWKHVHRRMQRKNQHESDENVSQWFERRKLKWLKRHQLQEASIDDTPQHQNTNCSPKRTGCLRDLNEAIDDLHIGLNGEKIKEKSVGRGRIRRPIGIFGREHFGKIRAGNRNMHNGRANSCPGRLPGLSSNLTFQLRRHDTERPPTTAGFGRFHGPRNWRRKWLTLDEEPTGHLGQGSNHCTEQVENGARNLRNDKKLKIKLRQLGNGPMENLNDLLGLNLHRRVHGLPTHFAGRKGEAGHHNQHKRRGKMMGLYHAGPKTFWKMRQMRLLKELRRLEEKKESVKNKLDKGCKHKFKHGKYMAAHQEGSVYQPIFVE